MPYTDQELENLLVDTEKDSVERKSSWKGDSPEKGRQAVCAFANDLPNNLREGVLFVGANDDGTSSNLAITDELLLTLSDIKTDGKILPPPSITVQKKHLLGSHIAVVYVRPSDSPPVRYEGRCWIRVGPRRALATIQEEAILNERRRAKDLTFDSKMCLNAKLEDLDSRFFLETYLSSAIAREILDQNGRTFEEQLASTKFVSTAANPVPTNLGILVSGKNPIDHLPGAYVEFLRLTGTELGTDISDNATISGRLDELILRTEDKFKSHNQSTVDLESRSTELRRYTYPLVAFQQLFRNAIMHRTYEHTNSPIRIYWFVDRLEIHSPGGLFGIVTPENFGSPGVTDYRNPNIAEALKHLGFAQRFGVGLATTSKVLSENGNPPLEHETSMNHIVMRMRAV